MAEDSMAFSQWIRQQGGEATVSDLDLLGRQQFRYMPAIKAKRGVRMSVGSNMVSFALRGPVAAVANGRNNFEKPRTNA